MAFDLGALGSALQGAVGKSAPGVDLGQLLGSAQKTFTETTPEQEAAIGQEASAVLLGAAPLVQDEAMQRYVNRVGRWVALHTERPDLPWRFGVLDTDAVNSFAAPGGWVFITRGLLGHLRSEAELAGVLAHECVHVVDRHYLAGVQKNAGVDLAVTLAAASGKADREQAARLTSGFKELYARGLDKGDEYAADAKAMVIAARAGYDPYGLPAALQTLAALSPADGTLAYMFKTHPRPDDRLQRVEALFPALEAFAAQPALAGRFVEAARR